MAKITGGQPRKYSNESNKLLGVVELKPIAVRFIDHQGVEQMWLGYYGFGTDTKTKKPGCYIFARTEELNSNMTRPPTWLLEEIHKKMGTSAEVDGDSIPAALANFGGE